MTQANVLSIVESMSLQDADTTPITDFYEDIVKELGFLEILTGTETVVLDAGDSTHEVATPTIRTLDVYTTAGHLDTVRAVGLRDVFGADWRGLLGTILAHTTIDSDSDTLTFVPKPSASETVTIIRTETRTDVPEWLELPIALDILSREYLRESDHQDLRFSQLAKLLSNLLFALVGIDEKGREK